MRTKRAASGDQEPVADVGDNLALAPPGSTRVARPMRQQAEYDAERDRDWYELEHGLAGDFERPGWRVLLLSVSECPVNMR